MLLAFTWFSMLNACSAPSLLPGCCACSALSPSECPHVCQLQSVVFSPPSVSATGTLSANRLQHFPLSSLLSFSSSDLPIHAGGPVGLACKDDRCNIVPFIISLLLFPHFSTGHSGQTPSGTVEKWEWLKPGAFGGSDSSLEGAKRGPQPHTSNTGDQGRMTTRKERRRLEGYSWGSLKETIQKKEESGKGEEQRGQNK